MREKELDAQIDHYKDLKSQGLLIQKDKLDMLYRNESRAQSSYTAEYDCDYDGEQIIDVETGKTPPYEIVKAIEGRVKLLTPTMPSVADKYIKTLERSKLRNE
jgi:hypothetical protein